MLIILHVKKYMSMLILEKSMRSYIFKILLMYFALQVIASMAKDDEERLCHGFGEKE